MSFDFLQDIPNLEAYHVHVILLLRFVGSVDLLLALNNKTKYHLFTQVEIQDLFCGRFFIKNVMLV